MRRIIIFFYKINPSARGRLRAQAITDLWPIYWNDPSWLFGILGDLHYASPSSLTAGSSACEQDICPCFLAAVVCPRTTSKAFQFLGLGCGLSEGGPLPSGVGVFLAHPWEVRPG